MKTVLVAVDGSEPSLKGVREAVPLARALDLRLMLVHVIPPTLLPAAAYADTINKIEEAGKLRAKEVLDVARAEVKAAGGEADVATVHGAPAEALADLAAGTEIWGVIIGAKGHNPFARVLLGSVADRLVHICDKPVLIVR